jgi:hypothetical protein
MGAKMGAPGPSSAAAEGPGNAPNVCLQGYDKGRNVRFEGCEFAQMFAQRVAFRGGVHQRSDSALRKGREKGCAAGAQVVQNFPERRVLAP